VRTDDVGGQRRGGHDGDRQNNRVVAKGLGSITLRRGFGGAVAMDADTLHAYLNGQRKHILGILEDLDEEALRRPVLPSGWNCLQLVHHLALDDERFWFRGTIAGEQSVKDWLVQDNNDGWNPAMDMSAEQVFAVYRREIELSDAIIEATPLDAAPAWWPEDLFGHWRLNNLGEVMLHMITEVATHAGHLDVVRELIDGRQWLVLP
jgi:hypothetical protein